MRSIKILLFWDHVFLSIQYSQIVRQRTIEALTLFLEINKAQCIEMKYACLKIGHRQMHFAAHRKRK